MFHIYAKQDKKISPPPDDGIEFHNDENEGMDQAGIIAHEEATKIIIVDFDTIDKFDRIVTPIYKLHYKTIFIFFY